MCTPPESLSHDLDHHSLRDLSAVEKPIEERKFTDQEVREILKKAVEKAPSRALVKSEGLSLAELKAIGGEVGIDPDRLEDAARSVALGKGDRPNRLVGAATILNYERRVEGELDPAETPEVLSLIRRIMGTQGEVDEIHGSLEWRTKGDSGERYVTLFSRDGTTTVRGSANLNNAAVLTYLPAGIIGVILTVVGFVTAAESGSLMGFAFGLSVIPILYMFLRRILRSFSESSSKRLQEVVNEVARLTEKSQSGRTTVSQDPGTDPQKVGEE